MKRIELNDVCRTYGRHYAVYHVSHTFAAGTCTAILGGNGAGKSTLLNMIATIESPSSGEIRYDEASFADFARRGRGLVGLVSHETYLYPALTGRENLQFFSKMYGIHTADSVVAKWLARVKLTDAADQLTQSYSRGMLQRLAIARSLLHTPQVILLDEPFTGLDQESKRNMETLFAKLRDQGCLVIMITHDFALKPGLVDQAILMHNGSLIEVVDMAGEEGMSLLEAYDSGVKSATKSRT